MFAIVIASLVTSPENNEESTIGSVTDIVKVHKNQTYSI